MADESIYAARSRIEKSLVGLSRLVEQLVEGRDPKQATRGMVMLLGQIGPVLEDLDRILSTRDREGRAVKRVLVVEDSRATRLFLVRALSRAGYQVEEAHDGGHALSLLSHRDFDVMVSDVRMPGIDGFELVRRVRASGEHGELSVIVNTALDADEDRRAALDAGADAYIAKSQNGSIWALLAEIEQLIAGDPAGGR